MRDVRGEGEKRRKICQKLSDSNGKNLRLVLQPINRSLADISKERFPQTRFPDEKRHYPCSDPVERGDKEHEQLYKLLPSWNYIGEKMITEVWS